MKDDFQYTITITRGSHGIMEMRTEHMFPMSCGRPFLVTRDPERGGELRVKVSAPILHLLEDEGIHVRLLVEVPVEKTP